LGLNQKKILVVDDETEYTSFLRGVLSSYEVREENLGSRVLQSAREFRPDLILLDINIPYVSGDLIASLIQQDERLKDIPIIFITGLLTSDEAAEKLNGRHLVLSKPVKSEELLKCVADALANRPQ